MHYRANETLSKCSGCWSSTWKHCSIWCWKLKTHWCWSWHTHIWLSLSKFSLCVGWL